MSSNGRKIDKSNENPFDNFLIDLSYLLNVKVFKPLGFTPNILTTISLICGLVSSFLFYKQKYVLAAIIFLVAYFFDCADGNLARHFNMVTVFGDYYDHIGDLIKSTVLFLVILYHPIDMKTKVVFFGILGLLLFAMTVHLGCQEKVYNPDGNDSLSYTKHFCARKENIKVTRYVGVGTTMLYITGFMLFLAYIRNIKTSL